jgi:hypothetical protein
MKLRNCAAGLLNSPVAESMTDLISSFAEDIFASDTSGLRYLTAVDVIMWLRSLVVHLCFGVRPGVVISDRAIQI